jgi:hypothetical protein
MSGPDLVAHVGDRLVLEDTYDDERKRVGVVVELRTPDGSPPYLVRWNDGTVALVYPGSDARVEPRST